MDTRKQATIIAQVAALFNESEALNAYRLYTVGGSAEYAEMLTYKEIEALEQLGVSEDDVSDAAYADDTTDWTAGLAYASEQLGEQVAALQATRLLAALGTSEDEVFADVEEL